MIFTSPRAITLSALGHVVSFVKGESKFLPPALRQIAVEQGLEPEDGAVIEPRKVSDDGARIEAVKAAMKAIAERNNADDFGADGIPKVKAIEAASGGAKPTDGKERIALWAEVANAVSE